MGVVGLASFLTSNKEKIATKARLSNTNVVIDSNNLENFLLDRACLIQKSHYYRVDKYGCDLEAYSRSVSEFFQTLTDCGITPVLVVDGSSSGKSNELGLNKAGEKVRRQRAQERMRAAHTVSEYQNDKNILFAPRLHHVVYRETLAKFGFEVHQVAYDANHLITKLANDLDCPVIGGDSDFIIYPVNKGFIILENFRYWNHGKYKSISCFIHHQDKFVESFPGLNKECLPILNAIRGRYPVELGVFNNIIGQLLNHMEIQVNFRPKAESHKKIVKVLQWLSNKTREEAVSAILDKFQPDKRAEIERLITNMIERYCNFETATDIMEDLERIYPETSHDGDIDLSPAKYLGRLFSRHDLTGPCLNIILGEDDYDVSFLSDFSQPSPYKVEFRPISVAMVLLRPKSIDQMKEAGTYDDEGHVFKIYTRVGHDENKPKFDKFEIKPLEMMETFGTLNELNCYSMIKLEKDRKKQLLMETFNFDEAELNEMAKVISKLFKDKSVVNEASVAVLLINYISFDTKTPLDQTFVSSVLMTIFHMASKKRAFNFKRYTEQMFGPMFDIINKHAMKINGQEYPDEPELYRKIVHNIFMLQAAYRSYFMLNNLLDDCCENLDPGSWFNSTLLFRMMLLVKKEGIDKYHNEWPGFPSTFRHILLRLEYHKKFRD